MKRPELCEFLKDLAADAMKDMVESGGSYPQRAVVMDLKGNIHVLVVPTDPLHGRVMAFMFTEFVRHVGGADVIAVLSDARMCMTTVDEWAKRPDYYSIAADESNRECLIVSGRSREHTALIVSPYQRTKGEGDDVIVFDNPEPQIQEGTEKLNLMMIPNIWQHVN